MSRRTSNLRIGKTEARKSEPVKPVAEGHIEATLAHVSPQVKSMIELQLITGMRPGEVCAMRTCDIDSTGPLWTYRPSHSSLARSFTPPRTLHFGNRARRRFAPSMGETLTIAAVEKPVVSKLVIKKAVYGDLPDGAKTDVTEKVAAMVKDGELSVEATNDNFGDPAEGIEKTLRVDYTFDGKEKSKTVNENETLTISAKGE